MNISAMFGGNIKRVQRGLAISTENTKTLAHAVDMDKSIIISDYTMSSATAQSTIPSVCASLTDATTVTINWGDKSSDAVVAYQVIEYY